VCEAVHTLVAKRDMLLPLISQKNFSNQAKIETIENNDLQKKIQLQSREKPPLSDIADQCAGGGGFQPTILTPLFCFSANGRTHEVPRPLR
jgi:hypothetical protein